MKASTGQLWGRPCSLQAVATDESEGLLMTVTSLDGLVQMQEVLVVGDDAIKAYAYLEAARQMAYAAKLMMQARGFYRKRFDQANTVLVTSGEGAIYFPVPEEIELLAKRIQAMPHEHGEFTIASLSEHYAAIPRKHPIRNITRP